MAQTHNRTCCACRKVSEKAGLVRIVRSKEGVVSVDLKGKSSGRGAYLCRSAECLRKARSNGALERALGVSVPLEVYDDLEKELGKDCEG